MPDIELDKFRFFIRDEQDRRRSSVWFISHRQNDVYVGAKVLGGRLKLSLHRDRNCQCGMIRSYRQTLSSSDSEAMRPVRWIRPETPERGAVHIASILFPTDFLRGVASAPEEQKQTFSLPAAPPGQATEVGLFYSCEQPGELEPKFIGLTATPLFYITLPSGEFLSIVARYAPFDPRWIPDLKVMEEKLRPLDGAPAPGERIENAHAILYSGHPDGHPGFLLAEISGLRIARKA